MPQLLNLWHFEKDIKITKIVTIKLFKRRKFIVRNEYSFSGAEERYENFFDL